MKGKASRRHHRNRMIARAKRIMRSWSNDVTWAEWASCRWADNMKKCSCDMCGNARKLYGPTVQELRFDQGDWEDGRD